MKGNTCPFRITNTIINIRLFYLNQCLDIIIEDNTRVGLPHRKTKKNTS